MKVLIADFDLFYKIGGGQTFYKNLIKKNPNIDFYYFRILEQTSDSQLPNAHPIDFRENYHISSYSQFNDLTPPRWIYRAFIMANNIAFSVAGHTFDVVDFPDYEQFGTMLRPAFQYHNVDCDRFVLSMHGNISTSIQLNWFSNNKVDQTLVLQEKIQYCVADIRYSMSKIHIEKWEKSTGLGSVYLDPFSIISLPKPQLAKSSSDKPSISFIGRTEKLKGPDIFIELASWLPRSKYSKAVIIGSDSFDDQGIVSSGFFLRQMIKNRSQSEICVLPAMSHDELSQNIFSNKSIVILPSKYDTLNLTAIESLFSGCPTSIGTGAGVVKLLKETFPHIPFSTIDINNIYSCIPDICSLLDNYDDYRYQLVEVLSKVSPELIDSLIEEVYSGEPVYDQSTRGKMHYWYSLLMGVQDRRKMRFSPVFIIAKKKLRKVASNLKLALPLKKTKLFIKNPKEFIRNKVLPELFKNNYADFRILDQGVKSLSLLSKYRNIFLLDEGSSNDLEKKLKFCWDLANEYRVDRVRIWREIARLESLRGNDVFAVTYYLRGMRTLGVDRFGDLETVIPILNSNGFNRESFVAEAMYGKSSLSTEMAKNILDKALVDNKNNSKWEYEFVDDRRQSSVYKVSIIVSLYNAALKLPLFLQTLQYQTLVKAGVVEIILIDSGSPADEYGAFVQTVASLDIPIIFARSAKRETIQSAWNRGIDLSRSPYLTFLGVDETILPECLEILANELDADLTLDWVQANSLMTNVDNQGMWVNDIMTYDRRDYKQDLVYLDTCYLSWVGALYRRSIHDRFGYYDASFTAAGDTEFKGRVLPFIKTKTIPKTLGIFRNYPEERTTQHPRAEIEDLRAWYLHRTLAGVEYAFANRNTFEAEDLFYTCLRYRKSFCGHWSTDIEYAYNIGCFLHQKHPNSLALKYLPSTKRLLDIYRNLDSISRLSKTSPSIEVFHASNAIKEVEQVHKDINTQDLDPMYQIFNDNRHEQHSSLWFSDI
jgi:glycosyltransferase involved in cell wall biosynthesis